MKWIVKILLICVLASQLGGQETGTLYLDQARDFYNQGNLEKALETVNLYISEAGEDPKAIRLKEAIELDFNLTRSRDLTNQALILIDGNDFIGAKELLGEALLADPSNTLAMDLYVSLSKVTRAETAQPQAKPDETVETGTQAAESNAVATTTTETGTTAGTAAGATAGTAVVTAAVVDDDQTKDSLAEDSSVETDGETQAEESSERKRKPSETPFGFSVGPRFTFANSNYLTLDSKVALFGIKADAWVFLPYWDKRLGLSATYTGDLVKMSGSDSIDFATSRIQASALIRTWVFAEGANRTTIGGGIGYDYFSMNNKEPLGAYLIRSYAGPSLNFFISDPIFARFLDGAFVENLSFKLNVDGTFSGGRDGLLFGLDSGLWMSYKFGLMGVGLGYDFHGLFLGSTMETYNSITITGEIAF